MNGKNERQSLKQSHFPAASDFPAVFSFSRISTGGMWLVNKHFALSSPSFSIKCIVIWKCGCIHLSLYLLYSFAIELMPFVFRSFLDFALADHAAVARQLKPGCINASGGNGAKQASSGSSKSSCSLASRSNWWEAVLHALYYDSLDQYFLGFSPPFRLKLFV